MKLIIGLGNPGARYQNTRHNVGHWFVEVFSKQLTAYSKKNTVSRKPLAVCKSTTVFMNESGKEIKQLITRYSLFATNLFIVHDDLDLPPGKWKLQFNRSAAGHKGVQSVIDKLGTQRFWRLRIGVGKPPAGKTGNQYVVEKPTKEERKLIDQAIAESMPRVLEWTSAL